MQKTLPSCTVLARCGDSGTTTSSVCGVLLPVSSVLLEDEVLLSSELEELAKGLRLLRKMCHLRREPEKLSSTEGQLWGANKQANKHGFEDRGGPVKMTKHCAVSSGPQGPPIGAL